MKAFYNYLKDNDLLEFNRNISTQSAYGIKESLILFNILLMKHSDIFQNFLIFQNENTDIKVYPHTLFEDIYIDCTSKKKYFELYYDDTQKKLFININSLKPTMDHIINQIIGLSDKSIPIQYGNILELILTNKLTLPQDQTIHPFYSSIDHVLNDIPLFKKLNIEIKKRILNGEFLAKYTKEESIKELDIDKLEKQIVNSKLKGIEEKEENLQRAYTRLQNDINNRILELQEVQMQKYAIKTANYINKDKLKRVIQDSRIKKIEIHENSLYIYTEPIILNYDKNKINQLPRLKNLNPKHNLGIGRHVIGIDLKHYYLTFTPVDTYRNYHIEDYNCYGTFNNPINDARRDLNLPKLISLALQMMQYATIGDQAGNVTINKAYELTDRNSIVYNGKEYYHHTFLEEHNKITYYGEQSGNYEDLEESERQERRRLEEELANLVVDESSDALDTLMYGVTREEGQEQETTATFNEVGAVINDPTRAILDEADEVNGVTREERQERRARFQEEAALIAEGLGENTNENN